MAEKCWGLFARSQMPWPFCLLEVSILSTLQPSTWWRDKVSWLTGKIFVYVVSVCSVMPHPWHMGSGFSVCLSHQELDEAGAICLFPHKELWAPVRQGCPTLQYAPTHPFSRKHSKWTYWLCLDCSNTVEVSTWKCNLHSLSSSCDYSGEEANTLSTIISFQVVVESDKVFLEPPLFHTTQSYFPQLLPIRLMLQTLCSFLVFLWTHPRRVVFVRRLDSLIEKVFRLCQQELLRSKCTFKPTWVFIRNSFCCSLTWNELVSLSPCPPSKITIHEAENAWRSNTGRVLLNYVSSSSSFCMSKFPISPLYFYI